MNWVKQQIPKTLTGIASVTMGFVLSRSVLLFLKHMHNMINFPFNVDYGEGPILDQVIRLAHLQNIYPYDISQFPYTISNYPPLYQLLQVPFALIFGPAFWYGRVINLISLVATAIFIALILHHLTKDWLAAITGGGLLLAVPYILYFAGFVRVDSLALGLSWAGLFVITHWHHQRKAIIFTAVLLTGAIFTRQSYGLVAPFTAIVWLFNQNPRWYAFELALWTGGLSAIVFLLLNGLSNGGFYLNIIIANVNPFFWETVQYYKNEMINHMSYLFGICVLYILVMAWSRQKAWWFATSYFLAATVSSITIGKNGSNVNYLFELSSALALLAGLTVAYPGPVWKGCQWVGKGWLLKTLLMVGLAYQINQMYVWSINDYYQWTTNRVKNESRDIELMTEMIQEADGLVLADEFMGSIPLTGKSLTFQPFEYKQLIIENVWDEQPLIQAIEEQKFALILLYDPDGWDALDARWTSKQLRAIEENYIMVDRLAQTQILIPR